MYAGIESSQNETVVVSCSGFEYLPYVRYRTYSIVVVMHACGNSSAWPTLLLEQMKNWKITKRSSKKTKDKNNNNTATLIMGPWRSDQSQLLLGYYYYVYAFRCYYYSFSYSYMQSNHSSSSSLALTRTLTDYPDTAVPVFSTRQQWCTNIQYMSLLIGPTTIRCH